MSGTTAGGRKASITNRLKHGEDFYERIGRKGGKISKRGKQKSPLQPHYRGDKKVSLRELIKVLSDLAEEI